MKKYLIIVISVMIILSGISYAEYVNSDSIIACNFMNDMGMLTRGYKIREGSKNSDGSYYYSCSSPYKEFGVGGKVMKNNIYYFAEGDSNKVRKLVLMLNVNSKQEAKQAHSELANSAELLCTNALGKPLPKSAKNAIINGRSGKWEILNANIVVIRSEDWPTGLGYDIRFEIE